MQFSSHLKCSTKESVVSLTAFSGFSLLYLTVRVA